MSPRGLKSLFVSSIIFIFWGCSSNKILAPLRTGDPRMNIDENNTVLFEDENFNIKINGSYKNQFIVFGLSLENNTEEDINITKDDVIITDGKGVIQNILDADQIANLYETYLYISFFPTSYYPDDPFYYPFHRDYMLDYYKFSMDKKLFLSNLYKNIFKFSRIPPNTKLTGDIYIQKLNFETPVKLNLLLKGNTFDFEFDKVLPSKK